MFIHKDSVACTKSELDLFTLPATQAAIERGYYVEYHPLSNIHDGGPLEFNAVGSGEDYCDLSASYLHIKAKLTMKDGSPLPENEPVASTNLFFHTLFSQIDVSLNERTISASNNTYPYRAYIETLLNYGEDAKKSLLTCEGFHRDEHLDSIDPIAGNNSGLKKRYNATAKSRIVDMIGQLHCDIFQQNRLLLNLVDLKIKMLRSKPEFCLISSKADCEYKVQLEHASLFIRKVKVSPGITLGHAKALEKATAKYPIDRVVCKNYSISAGSWSFIQDNVFLGPLPKRVIVTCVENAAMNGQYNLNPFFFDHYNANFLSIYVDGQPVPSKPLELDFEAGSYVRAYHRLFSGFNQDKGNYLSLDDYAKGHVLYAFDLSPDLCDGPHLNLQNQGNLRLEIKFAKALQKTISVLVYAEFENVIEITKSRHVLCDFAT